MQTTRWLLAVMALAGVTAVAAQPGQRPTKEERKQVAAQALAQADADGNGTLSAEELATFETLMRQRMRQDMFARADADGDGQVSLEELEAMGPPRHRGCGGDPAE